MKNIFKSIEHICDLVTYENKEYQIHELPVLHPYAPDEETFTDMKLVARTFVRKYSHESDVIGYHIVLTLYVKKIPICENQIISSSFDDASGFYSKLEDIKETFILNLLYAGINDCYKQAMQVRK